jgi:SAM-dependent methyltransferase
VARADVDELAPSITLSVDVEDEPDFDAFFTERDHYFHTNYLTDAQAERDLTQVLDLLRLKPGDAVLDAGCGDGRLAVRLALAGLNVTAVDHDAAQLERLRLHAVTSKVDVTAVECGLESLTLERAFDAALLWFTTFGFLDDKTNEKILRRLSSSLRPSGRLVIDTLNPIAVERYVNEHPGDVETWHGSDVQIDRYRFDRLANRLESKRTTIVNRVEEKRLLSLWLPSVAQWRELFVRTGLEFSSIHGHGRRAWNEETWEMVLVAEAAER